MKTCTYNKPIPIMRETLTYYKHILLSTKHLPYNIYIPIITETFAIQKTYFYYYRNIYLHKTSTIIPFMSHKNIYLQ